jgi:hypothetical protein
MPCFCCSICILIGLIKIPPHNQPFFCTVKWSYTSKCSSTHNKTRLRCNRYTKCSTKNIIYTCKDKTQLKSVGPNFLIHSSQNTMKHQSLLLHVWTLNTREVWSITLKHGMCRTKLECLQKSPSRQQPLAEHNQL